MTARTATRAAQAPDVQAQADTATPSSGGRVIVVLAVLFAISAVLAGVGAAADVETLTWIGMLGTVFFGAGASPLQPIRGLGLSTRLAVSSLLGFSVLLGVGALMADVHGLWHPVAAAVIVLAIAAGLHLLGLRAALPAGGLQSLRAETRMPRMVARGWLTRGRSTALGLAVIGDVVWLVTALAAGHINPGIGGLLTQISPAWFVGLILVLAAVAFSPRDERVLAFVVLSLILATTLTPALVYAAPRSQSAGKQVELTLLILRNHHIDPTSGIYPAYSAFFAGIAWMCRIGGISDPFGLSTYWPVVLSFLRVAELWLLFSRLNTSTRSRWLAVVLVVLVDGIGADYFSPQSVGYVMALGMFGLALRAVTPERAGDRSLGSWGTIWVLAVASLALAPTHELSPYIVAGTFVVLVVFGQASWWTVPVTLVPAAAWATLMHNVVKNYFSFTSLFDVSNFAPPKTISAPGLQRHPIVGLNSDALAIGIVVLIGFALVTVVRRRRDRRAWACLICPGVGLGLVAINPYGNEGIFRAALFGIPWLAALAVDALPPGGALRDRFSPAVWRGALLGLFVGLLATFSLAEYGMDGSSVLRQADYQAGIYFDRSAPPHSFIVPVGYGDSIAEGPFFAASSNLAATGLEWPSTVTAAMLQHGHPSTADLRELTTRLRRIAAAGGANAQSGLYIFWSPALLYYSEEYGLQAAAQTRGWLRLLRADPRWRVVYQRDGSYLFRLAPAST